MRDTHQEILFGITGQSLVWDAPEGRPASVTSVAVFASEQGDDGEAEFEPTGTVETNPDTTLSVAGGFGQTDPTELRLASGTGVVVGRAYLVTSAKGEKEWAAIAAATGTRTYSRNPMINEYAIGSTFQSTRITAPVDATWVADRNAITPEDSAFPAYRVVWTYVVGGVTFRHQSFVDLVRYSARHTVTAVDVEGVQAGWIDRLPIDKRREQGQPVIEQAFRDVRLDMLTNGKAARWMRHLDVMNSLVAYRAAALGLEAAAQNEPSLTSAAELAARSYRDRFAQLVVEPKVPLAVSPDGGSTRAERLPLFQR